MPLAEGRTHLKSARSVGTLSNLWRKVFQTLEEFCCKCLRDEYVMSAQGHFILIAARSDAVVNFETLKNPSPGFSLPENREVSHDAGNCHFGPPHPPFRRNFGRLVLGCIETDFLKENRSKYAFFSIFKLYTICTLLHRSKLNILVRKDLQNRRFS